MVRETRCLNSSEMLCKNGFAYIWNSQDIRNENKFLTNFESRLKDIYIQNWYETLSNSSKLESYRQYKLSYTPAQFLDVLIKLESLFNTK